MTNRNDELINDLKALCMVDGKFPASETSRLLFTLGCAAAKYPQLTAEDISSVALYVKNNLSSDI